MLSLIAGYSLAAMLGRLDFTALYQAPWFEIPPPLHFGLLFSWSLLCR